MDPQDCSRIVERTDHEFQIVQIAQLVPFISLLNIDISILYPLGRTHSVPLDEERLVVLSLYLSFIVMLVLNSHDMCVFLVLAPVCTLIHPFPVILR